MKVRGVDFIFYTVSDMKKSVAFYRDVLGLKSIDEPGETWAEFDTGNMTLAIGKYGPVKTGTVQVALAVDNLKKALTHLKAKKVTVIQDLLESTPCFMAVIQDPDGNSIILHERKDGTVG